ncbi:serine-enriched protein [Gigaspora margarita]|uniref:Serine-enriched protein n=1 Tax=Gigaspora margarita TaxID=4874 RepID=A0A8H4ES54_GIGMA|nr:serine-enriched protein [Gigaspora margarita]
MCDELNQSFIIDFSNLLENSQDFDTQIKVGEEPNIKEFKAHSIILSARSIYFKTALSSQWVMRENGIIIFEKPNISPSVFEILINYICIGKFFNNDVVSLLDIFIAADEIQLSEIKQTAEKHLLETESSWKFPKDFITICKNDIFTDLYQIALEIVCRNPKVIFESEDFLKVDKNVLIRLLKSDCLRLEEFEIWEYLIKWGIENTESILDDDLTKWTQTNFIDLEKVLHNYAALIATWIDKKQGIPYHFKDIPFRFELIYQASRENFSIDKFHESCDDKGPTVTVIKVRNSNEIIGGYNPLYWYENDLLRINRNNIVNNYNNNYKFKKTSRSFIFSLSNGEIPRLSCVSSKNEAIAWCKTRGPCFGFQDLWIEYNSYQRSAIGISKQHSYEIEIIDKARFEIEEYEIYRIIYKKFSFGIIFNRIFIISMLKNRFSFITSKFNFIVSIPAKVPGLIILWSAFIIMSSLATLVFIFIGVNDIVKLFTVSFSAIASIFFGPYLITITKDINYVVFLWLSILSFHSFAIIDFINNSVVIQILTVSSFIAAIILALYVFIACQYLIEHPDIYCSGLRLQ